MNKGKAAKIKPEIDKALLDACIHCGLCLPACPTYLATGRETESPRGRIYLLNLWQKEEEELSPRLAEHIDSCLGCFGCQTACPSGVNYEAILNQARPALAKNRPLLERLFKRFVFANVLPNYNLLNHLTSLLRLWQKLKGRVVLSNIAKVIPLTFFKKLSMAESYLPDLPPFVPLPKKSWNPGKKEGVVQLFSGCVMDTFYGPVNHAALRVLRAQRQVVEVPTQTCCGALAFHAGEIDIACQQAKANIAAFENHEGAIVVTSAGCGAMLKEYKILLAKDKEFKQAAEAFSGRVQDFSEFIFSHKFPESVHLRAFAPVPSVAYHAACHLAHAQNIHFTPEKLLTELADDIAANQSGEMAKQSSLQILPLVSSEHCCGSAGIFNLTHPDLSANILAAKIQRLQETGAKAVVTSNPGCLMQIAAGVKKNSMDMRVMHLAELLDEAYDLKGEND